MSKRSLPLRLRRGRSCLQTLPGFTEHRSDDDPRTWRLLPDVKRRSLVLGVPLGNPENQPQFGGGRIFLTPGPPAPGSLRTARAGRRMLDADMAPAPADERHDEKEKRDQKTVQNWR